MNGQVPNEKLTEEIQDLPECPGEKAEIQGKTSSKGLAEIDPWGTQNPLVRGSGSASLLPSPLEQFTDCQTVGELLCPLDQGQCCQWWLGEIFQKQRTKWPAHVKHAYTPLRPELTWPNWVMLVVHLWWDTALPRESPPLSHHTTRFPINIPHNPLCLWQTQGAGGFLGSCGSPGDLTLGGLPWREWGAQPTKVSLGTKEMKEVAPIGEGGRTDG